MAIRLALLAHHYRDDWEWTDEDLTAAERAAGPLARGRTARRRRSTPTSLAQMRAALADDLDAPTALAAVDAWAGASWPIDGDDATRPALVAAACDALLGVALSCA